MRASVVPDNCVKLRAKMHSPTEMTIVAAEVSHVLGAEVDSVSTCMCCSACPARASDRNSETSVTCNMSLLLVDEKMRAKA
jgi:hypothetical protein